MFHERNAVQVEKNPIRMWVLQEAMAVLLLVLKYPALNLVPETGAWIIGDGEDASRLGNFRYALPA